jgi:hypothetical protein
MYSNVSIHFMGSEVVKPVDRVSLRWPVLAGGPLLVCVGYCVNTMAGVPSLWQPQIAGRRRDTRSTGLKDCCAARSLPPLAACWKFNFICWRANQTSFTAD